MNKREYMLGINVLHGETEGFNGIGHDFDTDERIELYEEVKVIDSKKWLEKCEEMKRPAKNFNYSGEIFTYVGYVIKDVFND